MLENCQYSIKLINRLKELDQNNKIDYEQVDKAIYCAKKFHGDQKRKSGEPYYTHPLEVAYMVAEYKLTTDVIVAAILHDIVEDTELTFGMILDNFSERIMQMVDRLTRDRPDGTKWSVETTLVNIYLYKDREVLLIKLIDRLHNMQTIKFMDKKKQIIILRETLQKFLIVAYELEMLEIADLIYKICFQLNIEHGEIKDQPLISSTNLFKSKPILPDLISQNDIR
ncbi:MAG: HD domain-containing protein [Rickettsiaceae bacterium]